MKLRSLVLGMLLLPLLAQAAEKGSEDKPLPAPLQALQDQGFEIKGHIDEVQGMPGYVVQYHGQGATVFLTPDQQHAIVGNLVNNKGENLSDPQIDKYVYEPMSQQMWQRLDKADWIGIGKGPRHVYAFFDPYCHYCAVFWDKATPWVESGKVQLRVLLVGIIRKNSDIRAAALMQAKDPVQALTDYENTHWNIHPADPTTVLPETRRKLQANMQLMRDLGSNATPAMYYLDQSGRLQQQLGVPPDDATMVTIMGGKP